MKPVTKCLVYGGIATAVLGPALVASVVVSVAQGAGTFAGITIYEGVPNLTDGFQNYEPGADGMFGEQGVPNIPGTITPKS
jgi:hypothetical protein